MSQSQAEIRVNFPGEYRFAGFKPHPELPVMSETFTKLDWAIGQAYSLAGVAGEMKYGYLNYENHAFVQSPAQENGAPALSLLRYVGPKIENAEKEQNLIVLSVGSAKDGYGLGVMLRNDAGTHDRPDQVAADATVHGRWGIIHHEAQLTDTDIAVLAEEIQSRVQLQLATGQPIFIKKYSTARI